MNYTQQFQEFAKRIAAYDPEQKLGFTVKAGDLELERDERKKIVAASKGALKKFLKSDMGYSSFLRLTAKASEVDTVIAIVKEKQLEVLQDVFGHTANVYPHPVSLPANQRLYDHPSHYATKISKKVTTGITADFAKYGAKLVQPENGGADLRITVPKGQSWDQLEQELIEPLLLERITKIYHTSPVFHVR